MNINFNRRTFLQASAGFAAGMSLAPALADEPAKAGTPTGLIVRQESPYNAEAVLDKLASDWSTATERLFVRCHGKLPKVDEKTFRLKIDGLVDKPLELSLEQLAELGKAVSQHVTLTCAGNRRKEMSEIKAIGGVQWDVGAIGNAKWEGVPLAQVLAAAGVKAAAKHVWFEGLDEIVEGEKKFPFGGSIPLQKLASKEMPVLLATKMNGEPLTLEHGAPLRVVVPGFIGARSVKWLGKITVSDEPSPNHFVRDVYKIVKTPDLAEAHKTQPIYENVINAGICSPARGANLKAGAQTLTGFALPPGKTTATIAKVEVRVDDGEWQRASLTKADEPFCWALWKHDVKLAAGRHTLTVRATDSQGETQPEETPWNAKGYLYNSWHSIVVNVA
jgi:sulfite oxidase